MPTPKNTVVIELDADLMERLRQRMPAISSHRSRVRHVLWQWLQDVPAAARPRRAKPSRGRPMRKRT